MNDRSVDMGFYIFLGAVIAVALAASVRAIFRRRVKKEVTERLSGFVPIVGADGKPQEDKCPCGQPATHPRSRTVLDQGFIGWLRAKLGLMPTLSRYTNEYWPVELCELCSRIYNARLDLHLTQEVTLTRAELTSRVIEKMAEIERNLMKDVTSRYTEVEKSAAPAEAPILRVLPKIANGAEN